MITFIKQNKTKASIDAINIETLTMQDFNTPLSL